MVKQSENKLIKSKERVSEHGEVFTSERDVNAMLDLVKGETERIDSRFLEPACGDGNFLSAILLRKLNVVIANYKKSSSDFEKYSIIALSSVYGVELLNDNAVQCRGRLYEIWNKTYSKYCSDIATDEIRNVAKYILEKNILCGNALTLKKVGEDTKDLDDPIIFAEWTFVTGDKVKRRDYRLDQIMTGHEANVQMDLFDPHAGDWQYDEETQSYIPYPIQEFPVCDYRRIADNG